MDASAAEVQAARWRRTVFHPAVMLPAVAGAFSLAAGWVAGGAGTMMGVAGLAIAALVVAYRATLGSAGIVEQVKSGLLEKKKRDHVAYLRELRRKMRRDGDPRTGSLITKLRSIYEQLGQSADAALADYSGVLPQMHEQARELYDSCLQLLEHSFELWDAGRNLAEPANRESFSRDRETILGEVQRSVEHLDHTMDELRKASLRREGLRDGESAKAEHTRLRDELSRGIETARAVEQRMVALEEELGLRDRI